MRRIIVVLLFLTVFKAISTGSQHNVSEQQLEANISVLNNRERDLEIRRRIAILKSVEWVESRHNPFEHNISEDARGVMQIRHIMIQEINQMGYDYVHSDAWNPYKAASMFIKFQNRFNPEWDAELAARKWNGGRQGEKKPSTDQYWSKVQRRFNTLMDQSS